MTKTKLLLALSIFLIGLIPPTALATEDINLTIFSRDDCAHCHNALDFFDTLAPDYPQLTVNIIDIDTSEGQITFTDFTSRFDLSRSTPIIQLGTTIFPGFQSATTTGAAIRTQLDYCTEHSCPTLDQVLSADIADPTQSCSVEEGLCDLPPPTTLTVPFLGEITPSQFSLPALAITLGFIDGFNPCALWVLVMLLTLLIQTRSRSKMWTLAGIFILAETIMYYLILNVWFTTWNFIGLDRIVTPLIALLSIGAGIFFIYEYLTTPAGTCSITSLEHQVKTKNKISNLINRPLTWLTALGLIGVAFSVNIIEFACSIGIPQTFTKILQLNLLTALHEQLLILLYILFYMLDDLVVFAIAIRSFEAIGLTGRYAKVAQLLGGLLMIALGLILLFHRDWLIF